ncbi:MAG: OmpW family outer membrane protein [bacterium]
MRTLFPVLVVAGLSLSGYAQELGRGALTAETGGQAGLGRAALPAATYDGFMSGGSWGLKLALGWANVDWDIGPASGSQSLFAPQASLFYKATDNLDVNFSTLILSAEDTDSELGKNEADMARLALGVRYWFNAQARITPYAGGGLGYYLLDGKTESTRDESGLVVPADVSDVKSAPGAFLEGGVAFQVADNVSISADLTYDFLLSSADATINGTDENFDVKALSANLGVMWMF